MINEEKITRINEFRKQNFRDKVNHIVRMRKHTGTVRKIKYNFDQFGYMKPIRINNVSIANCIGYYRVESTVGNHVQSIVNYIVYDDIVKLDRMLKLKKFNGCPIQVKSVRKVVKRMPEKFVIKVGDELVLSNFWDSIVVKVISRTKFTAKVAVCREFFSEDIITEMQKQEFSIKIKLDELVYSQTSETKIIRLDNVGSWNTKGKYNSYTLYDGVTYRKSRLLN